MIRKALCAGLESFRCIDDGICIVVALYQRKRVLNVIAVWLELFQLLCQPREPEYHIRKLRGGVLHVLRGDLIEGKGACGDDHRHVVLPGVQLAPEAHGIGIDDIGTERLELFIEEAVHGKRDADILHRKLRGGNGL